MTNVSLADRWNGAKWVQQSTPNPPQSSTTSLFGVSCASATSCMAVGRFFNTGSGHWETLAEQWNGTTWSITTTPDPASATFGTLNGVSCKSASACTAAGGYSTTSTSAADRLVAEQWNGTSWSIKTTPAPAGTTFATFTGVSCSVASACTAAGGYSTTGGATSPSAPLAERWNGATWAIQSTTNPTSTGFTGDSCSAATACSAVGGQFGGIFAEGWNGTTWTSQTVATPPGAGILSGASCTAVRLTPPVSEVTSSSETTPCSTTRRPLITAG